MTLLDVSAAMRSPLLPYLLPPDLVCGAHFVLGSSLIALAPSPRKQGFNKCLSLPHRAGLNVTFWIITLNKVPPEKDDGLFFQMPNVIFMYQTDFVLVNNCNCGCSALK